MDNQIIRKDGKNKFVEFLNDGFEIGKISINFVEYDENQAKGNRIKQQIKTYMDFSTFLAFAQRIKSGNLLKGLYAKQQKGEWPEELIAQGGTTAQSLAKRNMSRADGRSEARQIKINLGNKVLFKAVSGPAYIGPTGLIVMETDANKKAIIEKQIAVALDPKDLAEIVLIVEAHINGFIAAGYSQGKFVNEYFEKKNANNENPQSQTTPQNENPFINMG